MMQGFYRQGKGAVLARNVVAREGRATRVKLRPQRLLNASPEAGHPAGPKAGPVWRGMTVMLLHFFFAPHHMMDIIQNIRRAI